MFANAWVHQTVEAMSIALMVDPQGDPEIIQAQEKMRATLDDWIPKILAAQEPDGYLQTAFTLDRRDRGDRSCREQQVRALGSGAPRRPRRLHRAATSWNRPSTIT